MPSQNLEELAFRESPAPQIITERRHILRCNQAFAALFGYEVEELEGELILKLYPSSADYYEIGDRCLRALRDKTTYEDERFMQHRDRQIFWARARGVTLTPTEPFDLMIWSFERIHHNPIKTADLTRREQEISGYIVNGLTCKETAQVLGISHRTVEVHRGRLMKKLGAKNTAELVSKIIMVTNPEH
ncbi:LuxR family transcriptional regulator [Pollutimonas thiosulfatoxidans]|uniref:LuxR family transcriptional regulator n=1 Tax=Pollutimonas thiosulfatoxidans TaxID=2028345 RepID=A0A410G818_9BURK|nr:LuxR C-terminal-related transcriptional regulator [Pollutimonas thiosulfatoxidans]MBF6618346.1 PAS domain S-box protein [Candidimonas sp.]QAA92468.1 LuxR family transcriptional regulator [Pollutimonas thiosulfatoxidans]